VKLQAGERDVYRRDFEHGIALVNPTDHVVAVTLEDAFLKIKGTQAPQVNDGSGVTGVTLPSRDGLVLLRPAPDAVLLMKTVISRPSGPSKVRSRSKLVLKGTVSPRGASGTVSVVRSRRIRGRWRSAGAARVRLVNGSYTYRLRPSAKGAWHFVANYSGCRGGPIGYASSRSSTKSVTVR
jgi:hypothetical protein